MPMSPGARKVVHYTGYMYPVALIAVGVAFPVISLIKQDEQLDTLMFAAIGLGFVGLGGFLLWRHSRLNPARPIQTVDDLPPAEGARQTRNALWFFGIASLLGTAFMTYQLTQLEFGSAQRVTVWAPVAIAYSLLGFWPAVLLVPALGLGIIAILARKLRAIREGQTGRV
jgi:hypothetical protein